MKKMMIVFLSLFLLMACQKTEEHEIITSFYPIQSLMQSLSDETYPVLMKGDAHDFELSPQERAAIAEADYFIYHGKGLEYWFDEAMMKEGSQALAVSQDIPSLEEDPHTWLDPHNALVYVETIAKETEIPLKNEKEVKEALMSIIQDYDALFASYTGEQIMVDHLAYAYLADRYKFQQVPIISGVSEGEASFREIIDAIEKIKDEGIQVIFVDPNHPSDVVKKIQKETGVEILPLYTMESDPGMSYLEALRANYESLKEGLLESD